jgi:BolA protein
VEKSQRADAIEETLTRALEATRVEVTDQSALHAGHEAAQEGGGHFQVLVVSEKFRGQSRVAAQRMVYAALGDMMRNEIHALAMRTYTPEQWADVDPSGL